MKKLGLLILSFLIGCASISSNIKLTHEGIPQGELLIFRESAFLASGEGLYFGESGKYFIVLDNNEYYRVNIDAGEHVFQAIAHASPAFELKVNIMAGKTTCIKGAANPKAWWAVLIPFAGNSISNFTIKEVECPSNDVLKGYKLRET